MTNEEKQAVLQFMGTVYGDAHKQDQMIIGRSGQLQPNSHVMKERFEEVIHTPTEQHQYDAEQQQNAPAPTPEPVASSDVEVVNVQQAAQELTDTHSPAPEPAPAPAPAMNPTKESQISDQLEFNLSELSKIDKIITQKYSDRKMRFDYENQILSKND